MGRFKFLIFVIIAALLSCYKIPSKPPQWELRLIIPIGDSLITAQEMINDTAINHKFTIEQDSNYNDTLWTVFQYSDTASVPFFVWPSESVMIFTMTLTQNVGENIDTTQSYFHSISAMMITKVYLHGRCDYDFYGTVVCSLSPVGPLQHFDPFSDSFPVHIPETSNLDTTMAFVIDSFPLGPYKNIITLYPNAGSLYVDSSMGYSKIPIDFLANGDTIVTVLKGVANSEELKETKNKDIVKRIILHLVITNRTSAGYTASFQVGKKDSIGEFDVYHTRPVTIEPAPSDPFGFTTGEATVSVLDDTLTDEYIPITFEDSLYWKATLTIPPLGNVFMRPEDWIRLSGYIYVDIWFDSESLEEGE